MADLLTSKSKLDKELQAARGWFPILRGFGAGCPCHWSKQNKIELKLGDRFSSWSHSVLMWEKKL